MAASKQGPGWFSVAAGLLLSACAQPAARQETALLGVGTPGVAAYVPAGEAASLQSLLDRCGPVPRPEAVATRGLPAACAQLHRTMHNQPGNAQRAAR